jgi:hypothetical protein
VLPPAHTQPPHVPPPPHETGEVNSKATILIEDWILDVNVIFWSFDQNTKILCHLHLKDEYFPNGQ